MLSRRSFLKALAAAPAAVAACEVREVEVRPLPPEEPEEQDAPSEGPAAPHTVTVRCRVGETVAPGDAVVFSKTDGRVRRAQPGETHRLGTVIAAANDGTATIVVPLTSA